MDRNKDWRTALVATVALTAGLLLVVRVGPAAAAPGGFTGAPAVGVAGDAMFVTVHSGQAVFYLTNPVT